MAVDEALLRGTGATLRFYEWSPPGLSLGYFQRWSRLTAELQQAREAGFEIVRRQTGGGAIAHENELTFALVDEVGGVFSADVELDYQRVHSVFQRALGQLGGAAGARGDAELRSDLTDAEWLCFAKSSPVDLVADSRKLLGSAQRRTGGRVLHHGSLPLEPNRLTPAAASVRDLIGRSVEAAELIDHLVTAFAEEFSVQLTDGHLNPAERRRAERIAAAKYAHPDWTERRRAPAVEEGE